MGIHITTQSHGDILDIISYLNSYGHEVTNPVIKGTPMWIFKFIINLLQWKLYPLRVTFQRMCLLERVNFENLLHLFLGFPIFLDDVIDDMICLIDNDALFTLDDINVMKLYLWYLVEGVLRDFIKSLHQSFKGNHFMCFHEEIICFNINIIIFTIIVNTW